jgi:hypothetical protein
MARRLRESCYRRLTAAERYRLAMEAYDRGDTDELQRLAQTCPGGGHAGCYVERIAASRVAALVAGNFIWQAHLAVLSVLRAKDLRGDVLESLEEGATETVSEPPDSDPATQVHVECAAAAFGFLAGIGRFSQEIGVEPRKLLRLEPSCLPVWDTLSAFADGYVYDGVAAEDVHRRLMVEWASFVD